ncbi:MAG: recombinase family protein [Defluviitaleaceae bacterium]|nr:recombinase family protein [Defluviitaleaceae bacterium]
MSRKLYNVGIYIRLSRDSIAYRDTVSMSIENQQAMLSKFITMMPGWVEKRIYIDDGASGGNFNRKGFQDMMEDVRQGVITLVLVQDLSRFGRNYLEAGRYLEEELPSLGCRFVALSEGIDTEDGENDIMPFLNMMNDYYLKNLRDKIISALRIKAKDGHKLSGSAPYGYVRNPKERTRLIVDESAACVVRQMFELRAAGISYAKITAALNSEAAAPTSRKNSSKIWKITTIKRMLVNESYIGHTISFKRKPRSYRNGKSGIKDESQWIRVENTHEAIVDLELWHKVQAINQLAKDRFSHSRSFEQSLFSGLIICADCQINMAYHLDRKTSHVMVTALYGSYHCRTHTQSGRTVCSWHRISEKVLKKLVLAHIKEQAHMIALDEKRIFQALKQKLLGNRGAGNSKGTITKERRNLEHQLHNLDFRLEQLYEDKVVGAISAETFVTLANSAEAKRIEIEDRLALINKNEVQSDARLNNISRWIGMIKEKSAITEVDRDLLESLIEKIEIGEKAVIDGIKTQEARIYWKYAGLY